MFHQGRHSQRGHSKSTFVEERRGVVIESEQKRTRRGGGSSVCVRSLFFKKNAEIKIKFSNYSPVFPINYNGRMKY